MSSKVTGWVWDLDLPIQRKCVLLWLAERATDNGVCFPGQAEIRQKTQLSESMVRRYLHWLASDQDDKGQARQPLVRIIHRPIDGDRNTSNVYVVLVPWANPGDVQRELEELKHIPAQTLKAVGCTGAPQGGPRACTPLGSAGAPQLGGTGATEEPSPPDPDRNSPPLPPTRAQQQPGGFENVPSESESLAVPEEKPQHDRSEALVHAFYRGLGAEATDVTAVIRRRDVAIARQLTVAGATPAEAETYAREASATSGRIAPVDLRSFERERLGWLARRRGTDQTRSRFVDRTGQPPSWHSPPSEDPQPPSDQTMRTVEALNGSSPAAAQLAGAGFTETLRSLLVRDLR